MISEFQLPGLRYLGSTRDEIEKAKAVKSSWTLPYCNIPQRTTHLFQEEMKRFKRYTDMYANRKDKRLYITSDEYREYIEFTKKHAVQCNENCSEEVCPFCHSCKVDHWKDSCSDEKWDLVKKHHGTWRQWFMDTKYPRDEYYMENKLHAHEWAIWHSYYDPIVHVLYARNCPCYEVLYDRNRSENDVIDSLRTRFDCRMLELNKSMVKKIIS